MVRFLFLTELMIFKLLPQILNYPNTNKTFLGEEDCAYRTAILDQNVLDLLADELDFDEDQLKRFPEFDRCIDHPDVRNITF
jgi:hypothetical protein